MASIMTETLSDQLLVHPEGSDTRTEDLISPEDAKNKIIVKAKGFKEAQNKRSNRDDHGTSSSKLAAYLRGSTGGTGSVSRFPSDLTTLTASDESDGENKGKLWRQQRTGTWLAWMFGSRPSPSASSSSFVSSDSMNSPLTGRPSDTVAPHPTEEYARTIYLMGRKLPKGRVDNFIGELYPCACTSLNEQKAKALLEAQGVDAVRRLCFRQLMRAYPHSTRIGSGNFDLVPLLLAGFQLVALNYQSLDLSVILNEGLFMHENGGCGYILKPPSVRRSREVEGGTDDAIAKLLNHRSKQDREDFESDGLSCTLSLTILSGHGLPKPMGATADDVISPCVRVSVRGASCDSRTVETRPIRENGFNPRWDQQFLFDIDEPSLALLAFEVVSVKGSKKDFVAAMACPMNGVKEGIRWVPLRDRRHNTIDLCGLLVKIRITGDWADVRRKQRANHRPLSRGLAKAITKLPGGLDDDSLGGILDLGQAENPKRMNSVDTLGSNATVLTTPLTPNMAAAHRDPVSRATRASPRAAALNVGFLEEADDSDDSAEADEKELEKEQQKEEETLTPPLTPRSALRRIALGESDAPPRSTADAGAPDPGELTPRSAARRVSL